MKKETKSRLMKSLLTGTLTATIGVGSGILGSELQKKEYAPVIQQYEQTLDSKSNELDELIKENENLETQNSELKTDNQSLQSENADLKAQIFNLNEEISNLNDEIETFKKLVENKDKAIEDNKLMAIAYTEKIQELENKIDELETKLNNSEFKNSELKYQLDKANSELEIIKADFEALKEENIELNQQLNEKNENQSAVAVIKTGIDMIREKIDEKTIHSASDRADFHNKFDVTYNYIYRLYQNEQLTDEQVDALESYLDTLVDSYVYKNISNSVQTYYDSDYYEMKSTTTDKQTDTELSLTSAFSNSQGYAYGSFDGENAYGIINNGKTITVLGDQLEEYDINVEDVRKENISGMLSELNSFLNNYSENVTYDSETDSYSISFEYNGEEYLNNATYDIDENGNLGSYTLDTTGTTSIVNFDGTMTQAEFDENFAKVNAKVQEEKSRIEASQTQQQ